MIIFQWSLVLVATVALSQGTNEANEAVSINQPTAVATPEHLQSLGNLSLERDRRFFGALFKIGSKAIRFGLRAGRRAA